MPDEQPIDPVAFLRGLRATRSFTDEPVSPEALADILEVARWSGSSMNQQEWQLVVVTDAGTLEQLSRTSPTAAHLARAPLAIAIVMPGERKITDAFDEGRMAERIMLAARACGLASGIAWVSPGAEAARELLGVPAERTLRSAIAIGHANQAGRRPKSPPGEARRPLDETVHYERWGRRRA